MTATILDEFEQDLQPSTTIPHCQIINPPNLSITQIQQLKPPFGFFIPKEKAEQVKFEPTNNWSLQSIDFEGGASSEGYLATACRFAIIHRSQIEVEGLDSRDRYYYLGLAYQYGQLTEVGQQAQNTTKVGTKSMFRTKTRMLVFFLDEENNLLHESPLQFTSRGGFGGSFGNELREYYAEINRVFGKLKKTAGMALSSAALARVPIDFKLGFHKSEGKAPFACIKSRLAPAIDQVYVTKQVERRGYSVELNGVPIESLLISGTTEAGQSIMQFYKLHEKFPLPNRGEIIASSELDTEIQTKAKTEQWDTESEEWNGEF